MALYRDHPRGAELRVGAAMIEEIWKDIPGYEGSYQASDQGRIRSLDRYVPCTNKAHTRHTKLLKGQIIKPQKHNAGYASVPLSGKSFLVHILIMRTFVGPCPEGCEVAHNDGTRKNNVLNNLRYDTVKGNAADRVKHGTSHKGSKSSGAVLTDAQVLEIRASYGLYNQYDLADKFGVSQATIWKIIHRLRWSHI